MNKPYSDRRWHDNPKGIDSLCNNCKNWKGFGECKKYDDKVPDEIINQSFPNTSKFKEDYCKYRKPK